MGPLILLAAQAAAPVSAQAAAAPTAAPNPAPAESAANLPAAYGPKYVPPKPKRKPASAPAPDPACNNPAQQREIVICAQRPNGYRIDPAVMEAKRLKRSGGRARRPENFKDNSQCVVGPAGCQSAGINLIGAAITAATMAKRIAEGKEIGSMFKTTPEPTEYDLYVEAKHRREAEAAEAAARAKAKAASAAAAASPAPAETTAQPPR